MTKNGAHGRVGRRRGHRSGADNGLPIHTTSRFGGESEESERRWRDVSEEGRRRKASTGRSRVKGERE